MRVWHYGLLQALCTGKGTLKLTGSLAQVNCKRCLKKAHRTQAPGLIPPPATDKQPQFTGYDGKPYTLGSRIEIHPGTDLWMKGARFGEVVGCSLTSQDRVKVRLDKLPERVFSGPEERFRALQPGDDCALLQRQAD